MAKVKFKTSIVFQNGISYAINEIAEVEDKLAKQLIEEGIVVNATEVIEPKKTATKKPKAEDVE